jgi:hypothetical protein
MELEFAPSHVTDNVAPATRVKPPMDFRAHEHISNVDLGFLARMCRKLSQKFALSMWYSMCQSHMNCREGGPYERKHHVIVTAPK